MEPPRVSVAIVTYNQRDLLRACLNSVLAQGYPNLQVVVADDASSDGTAEMLAGFAERSRGVVVPVIAPRNQGVTANSNAALAACDGAYIAWMGGDDLMLPGKLRAQVDFLETRPDHAICYHDLEVFDSASGVTLRHFNHGAGSLFPHEGGPEVLVEHGTFFGGCSAMMRRAAAPPNGFDPRIAVASDWLFWIETALKGKVCFLPQVLGRYRRHPGSVTAVRRHDPAEEFLTLAIVECTYPHLLPYVRRSRARLYYLLGVRLIVSGRDRRGLTYLAASLRQALPSVYTARLTLRMARAGRARRV